MGEQEVHPHDNMEKGDETPQDVEMDEEEDTAEEEEEMSPEEFEALNSQMDQLNNALDFIEQKNDNIYAALIKLLETNRETREQMKSGQNQDKGEKSINDDAKQ